MQRHRQTIGLMLLCALCAGCAGGPGGAAGGAAAPAAAPTSAEGAGGTTLVAIAPPAAPGMTLPKFLGLDAVGAHLCAVGERACDKFTDMFPSLKPIPSPEELGPDADPGSQAAAEIKADEEAAADKAAALQYLADVGCGCYPGVEEAFLSALDDCNELVRFTAARELRNMAGKNCGNCRTGQCCSPALQQKLARLGFETDDEACPFEPSPRVRRMARLALAGCGGGGLIASEAQIGPPTEGPSREALPTPAPDEPGGAAAVMADTSILQPALARLAGSDTNRNRRHPGQATDQRDVRPVSFSETAPSLGSDRGSNPQRPARGPHRHASLVVARVNGNPVYDAQLQHRIDRRLVARGEHGGDAAARARFVPTALDEEVHQQLLVAEARRHWRPGEVAQRSAALASTMPAASAEERLAAAWLDFRAASDLRTPDYELRGFYEANQRRFWRPERVRYESITVPIDGRVSLARASQVAEYLRARLLGAPATAPLDTSIARPQTHGWTPIGQIRSETLSRLIASLPVGRVGPIVRDEQGLHIVRVLQRRPAGLVPFDDVVGEIRSELITAKKPNFARGYLAELRKRANVWTVFDGMTESEIVQTVAIAQDAVDSTNE